MDTHTVAGSSAAPTAPNTYLQRGACTVKVSLRGGEGGLILRDGLMLRGGLILTYSGLG